MSYAIIDLGSNTVRLCIYEYHDGKISTLINQKETAGLAGYVSDGVLTKEGLNKAVQVVSEFVELAKKLTDKKNIHILATASLRNIKNCNEAAEKIREAVDIMPDVLSGEEEALLDFMGVSHQTSCEQGVLIDIGGGSTELVLFENNLPVKLTSIPIGCLNLYKAHVGYILPDKEEIKAIKKDVNDRLESTGLKKDCPIMIGTGGTLRASDKLARHLLSSPDNNGLSAEVIKELYLRLKKPDKDVLDAINKVIPERMLTIMPGLILLKQAIRHFGCETIYISPYGVREGYLLKRVLEVEKGG